jgi:hypothetical protein
MSIERVSLPSGGWADLHTVITFGRQKVVRAALIRENDGTPEERVAQPAHVLAAMTSAWSFPESITPESFDQRDARDVSVLTKRAIALYNAGTKLDPKAPETSPGSPPEQP